LKEVQDKRVVLPDQWVVEWEKVFRTGPGGKKSRAMPKPIEKTAEK